MAYYITGDCHGDFDSILSFFQSHPTNSEDVMILLGDAGFNYYLNKKDLREKELFREIPATLFCIHGNHEQRPYLIETYKEKEWKGGTVYYEEEFPNLLFAKDGEIYDLDGKKAIVLGGAYSVDKFYRLQRGYAWFPDEQPSDDIKAYAEQQLDRCGWKVDYVFSHTCPLKYEPTDLFLDFIDQSKVDKSTEQWLSGIEEKLEYGKWYFGHFHGNRVYDQAEMLYEEIKVLG